MHGRPAKTKPDLTICTQGKNGRHSSRPQTLFKSSANPSINLCVQKIYEIWDSSRSIELWNCVLAMVGEVLLRMFVRLVF
jgi:hypothetical protein